MHRKLENFVDRHGIAERDESEATRSSGGRILHDHDFGKLTESGEVLSDRFRRGLP